MGRGKRLQAREVADFIADFGVLPWPSRGGILGKLLNFLLGKSDVPEYTFFGLVMNTERVVNRRARHELANSGMAIGTIDVPISVFRAAAYSQEQAESECNAYNIALERLANQS